MPLRFLLLWFALTLFVPAQEGEVELPTGGFLEPETPFLRSALTIKDGKNYHRIRRGVIIPLGRDRLWSCFDPDTLRWAAVWRAPVGQPPMTYDSMAAVSFPDEKAKASRAPKLQGELLFLYPNTPSRPTEGTDPRTNKLLYQDKKVGPFPPNKGSWIGITFSDKQPVLHYRIGSDSFTERVSACPDFHFKRLITNKTASDKENTLLLKYKSSTQVLSEQVKSPENRAPLPIFPESYSSSSPSSASDGPFTVRSFSFPKTERAIRAVDLDFRSDGTAFLATFDGDIWQIKGLDGMAPQWLRIATGIFEPMSIAINGKDEIFVLGRDQITQLIDRNGDEHIDAFLNASDAFHQTQNTRDYATSLEIDSDGSFLIAKGGLYKPENDSKKQADDEHSAHRGTVLRITRDGKTTVLADGLRLPYVGLRNDGSVFASDQQGNHIPSTPIHLISHNNPFLGFEPTNFRKSKSVTEPLLWYPYQANRSGAAFCTTSSKAFPDLPDTFLQVSWNGRLFAIETPDEGQPFSWKLPLQLDFPSLNGAVHPQSGRLYLTGLGISGYLPTTPNLVGLASVEQTQSFPSPRTLEVSGNTITVTFNRPLTETESITPGNPTLRLFNVKRTPKYGSGHYLWNDEPGEHQFAPKSFQLSPDRQSFQATFDTLRQSDLFDFQLNVNSATSTFPVHLYTRPHHLSPASQSDLRRIAQAEKAQPKLQPGQAELGKPLFTQYACSGCHSLMGENLTGPALNNVAGRLNTEKLRESILNPTAEITEGYEPAMPSFEGVIPPQDLEHLLSYLETLKGSEPQSTK